jgi:hypothetical protein
MKITKISDFTVAVDGIYWVAHKDVQAWSIGARFDNEVSYFKPGHQEHNIHFYWATL